MFRLNVNAAVRDTVDQNQYSRKVSLILEWKEFTDKIHTVFTRYCKRVRWKETFVAVVASRADVGKGHHCFRSRVGQCFQCILSMELNFSQ